MEDEVERLIAEFAKLSTEERRRLLRCLLSRDERSGVRDAEAIYHSTDSSAEAYGEMTHVTIELPDELAMQARAAGLLAKTRLAEIIRAALNAEATTRSSDVISGTSGYDVIKDFLGKSRGGSTDLSTNPDHLKDYGR